MKNLIYGFIMDLSMFTIIPMPYSFWKEEGRRHMMKLYPLVGLIVGLINYCIYKILLKFNVSIMLLSAITMVTPFILTGMIHLDGFMDVSDALLSRRNKEEKIRILKDPNTGAFSVIALAILFILEFSAIQTVIEKNIVPPIIIIQIMSRALMGILLLKRESMKESSLGAYYKKGTNKFDIIILYSFIIISTLIMYFIASYKGVLISLGVILSALISVNKSIKELGGMSGDSAGYGLVISEFIGILILALI